jgi:protocatechuate 3,4-dioxygenase beta subunit
LLILAATVGATGLVGTSGWATPTATCRPTASQGPGPFEGNRAAAPFRSRIGRGHVLVGRVLRYPDCAPVRGAAVELWQESPNGRYDQRGHARVVTDRTGTFRFEGPVPPGGSGRSGFPPHIHVRVTAGAYDEVVVTYFVRAGERQGRITVVLASSL